MVHLQRIACLSLYFSFNQYRKFFFLNVKLQLSFFFFFFLILYLKKAPTFSYNTSEKKKEFKRIKY